MRKRIEIHEADDIVKINRIVSQYAYDIWIHSKSGMVDAKSLLGMFILSLKEDMFVVVEDHDRPCPRYARADCGSWNDRRII